MGELPLVEALRTVPLLADLSVEHLQWLADHSDDLHYAAGEVILEEGAPAIEMSIILEGDLEARADDRVVFQASAGQITGKLPHSRLEKIPRAVRAMSDMRVARIHESHFGAMMDLIPELEVRLIRVMADRIREFTTSEVQQSKLAALGKLSAGLAHELNNPAAAAARAADTLRKRLGDLRVLDCRIARADLTPDQRALIVTIEDEAVEHARTCTPVDALSRSDREEELGFRLTDLGVQEGWDLAPELVDAGFTPERLDTAAQCSAGVFRDVLVRIAVLISLDRLAEDVQTSMARISDLVKSIKEYSYMDTAGERDVDVHKDIENTLRILASKINRAGVAVEREYDKLLPSICANGSELNQVWTNLIDNAVDAMAEMPAGEKVLRIRTARKVDRVAVEVFDTGPGVPEEIRQRIFEPFFTTKKQGEGTGLGLDVVRRIIARHHGDIRLESKPGRTCFQIMLPIRGRRKAA